MMKNQRKPITLWKRGQIRSFHARGAKAWKPSFVTSTITMLISLDTSVRAARGTGQPVELSAMCLSVQVAGKLSLLAGRVYRRAACLMHQAFNSWISTEWRGGKWRGTVVLGIFFRPRGGDVPPIVKVVKDLPVCLVVPRTENWEKKNKFPVFYVSCCTYTLYSLII